MINKLLLLSIFDKKAKGEIPLGCEASLRNDDMIFSYSENGTHYIIEKIENSQVSAIGYKENSNEPVESISFPINKINSKDISVTHHYKLWKLEYRSLLEAFLKSNLGYNRLKWSIESSNERRIYAYYQKNEILRTIIENRNKNETICFFDLKNIFYGPYSALRTDFSHNRDLRWKLSALKDSGDIDFTDKILYLQDIKVKPQALNTLSKFERDEQESRNSKRMARTQQLLSLLLFLSTAANVFFTHFKN